MSLKNNTEEITKKLCSNKHPLLFIILFISCFLFLCIGAPNVEAGTLYKEAHKGVKKIYVEVRLFQRNQNVLEKFIGAYKDNKKSPFSQELIGSWAIDVLKRTVTHPTNIEYRLVNQNPISPVSSDKKDTLHLVVDMSLWNKNRFSPELNYDMSSIILTERTVVEEHERGKGLKTRLYERRGKVSLISLPNEKVARQEAIKLQLEKTISSYIPLYINCANGGECEK